jgi:hypothetical protein
MNEYEDTEMDDVASLFAPLEEAPSDEVLAERRKREYQVVVLLGFGYGLGMYMARNALFTCNKDMKDVLADSGAYEQMNAEGYASCKQQ